MLKPRFKQKLKRIMDENVAIKEKVIAIEQEVYHEYYSITHSDEGEKKPIEEKDEEPLEIEDIRNAADKVVDFIIYGLGG